MKTYDTPCPFCGHWNRNLYLQETDGLMECSRCFRISRCRKWFPAGKMIYTATNRTTDTPFCDNLQGG